MKFEYFSKICREDSCFIQIRQEWPVLYIQTNIHFWSYVAQFFTEWEIFQTKVVEKIQTHVLYSVIFFPKSCLLWANVETSCRAGQATWQYGALVLHAGFLRIQTHTQNIILIAFLLQQWLQERTSLLRHTYTACLVSFRFLGSAVYASPLPLVHATCLTHLIRLDFINLIIFVWRLRTVRLHVMKSSPLSHYLLLLRPSYLQSAPYSGIPSAYVPLSLRDQVSHSYETTEEKSFCVF